MKNLGLVPLAIAIMPNVAWAEFGQHAEANAGEVEAILTVVGVPVTLSQPPIAQARLESSGSADEQLADTGNLAVSSVPVLSAQGIDNVADSSETETTVHAEASAAADEVSLLGGLVEIEQLVTDVSCDGTLSDASCTGSTVLSVLRIGGSTVPLGEISPNTSIPVVGPINLLGNTVTAELELVLNEQLADDAGTDSSLRVNGAHLFGQVSALGGLISLDVDVIVSGPTASVTAGTTAAKWGQCGGLGWTGPTTCVAGATCTYINASYQQCI